MKPGEWRAFMFGLVSAGLAGLSADRGWICMAVMTELQSLYWFMLAVKRGE
jgi:hypothetical protein